MEIFECQMVAVEPDFLALLANFTKQKYCTGGLPFAWDLQI
jgi:hypothetical protein